MALYLWGRQEQNYFFSHFIIDMKAAIAVGWKTVLVMPSVTQHCYKQVGHTYSIPYFH